jgi:hypothetical protein
LTYLNLRYEKNSYFGDKRLLATSESFLTSIKDNMSVVLRRIAPSRTKEVVFGRFLQNVRVTILTLKSAFMNSDTELDHLCAHRHILFVEDTSELSFGLNPTQTGLGQVGNGKESGFFLHPVITLDAADGGCLGLGEVEVYKRPIPTPPPANQDPDLDAKEVAKEVAKARHRERQKQVFNEKESYRWYSAIESAFKRTPSAEKRTVVADRESDIYDAMCGFTDLGCDFVLRAQYLNRSLNTTKSGHSLENELNKWAIKGFYDLDLPATDKRSAHKATLDIKFGVALLARPHTGVVKHLPKNLAVHVIEVKERLESVVNNEKPVHWVLLTSHSIDSVEKAMQIIRFYRWRWVIEQTFRTLKSQGLAIEESEVTTFEGLANLAFMALIAAVQIMQLVQAREGKTAQPIESVFSLPEIEVLKVINPTLEGKTEKLKNPHPPESLAFAAWVIARLAGWSGYIKQRPPGPITMKIGLIRFKNIAEGFFLRI